MYLQSLRISVVMWLLATLVFGGIYPAFITGGAKALFPAQSSGTIIYDEKGNNLGSELIGQNFSSPKYFWGRLSATSPVPYNAAASTGSNYSVGNSSFMDAAKARIAALKAADSQNASSIPIDLVTASGSGLDPEISIAAAMYQLPRIAKERHVSEDSIKAMVAKYTAGRQWGIFGEPRVNVLKLNLALDAEAQDGSRSAR